jgi:hypothetical protein
LHATSDCASAQINGSRKRSIATIQWCATLRRLASVESEGARQAAFAASRGLNVPSAFGSRSMRRSCRSTSVERWPIETSVVSGSFSFQHAVDRGLGLLVERRGRLVEEQPFRPGEQRAGEREALLLAAGEALLPVVALVEPRGESGQLRRFQRGADVGVGMRLGAAGIGDRLAQRPDRQIGPLRQEHHVRRRADAPARMGPDSGDGAEDRRFARARRAGEQRRLAGRKRQRIDARDLPPVRQAERDGVERNAVGGGALCFLRFALTARAFDRGVERRETVEHGFELGERGVVVDEEGQRAFDAPEGARGLRHDAELDLAGEIERRGEDVGDDRAQLAIAGGEGHQFLLAIDDLQIVGVDRREPLHQRAPLGSLAFEQRNLLGIFAQPRQREAEIGLVALALEGQRHQRAADPVRDQRADSRIEQRHPEQEARQHEVRAGHREVRRQAPQHDRERNERGQRRDQQDGIGVDAVTLLPAVDEPVDVLGDALVGIVHAAAARVMR